jgi:hypothetical protein
MSQKMLKFAQKVNEIFPEIPVDELIALSDPATWFTQKVNELNPKIPANELIAMWEEIAAIPFATCKHVFLKGKNANTQCKVKVKEGSVYSNKHSKH